MEPIALEAGVPVRTLQEFLSQHQWDHQGMRERLQQIVRDEHAGEDAEVIGIIDETSFSKKEIRRRECSDSISAAWASRRTAS